MPMFDELSNSFALPPLVGCGIDYGIRVVNAWRHEQGDLDALVGATGRTLVMNALTTCFGFFVGAAIVWLLACALIVLPVVLVWQQGVGL